MIRREYELEDFMDNREKRIAFAFMALDGRKNRLKKFRQPTVRNPFIFCILLTIFTLVMALMTFTLRR